MRNVMVVLLALCGSSCFHEIVEQRINERIPLLREELVRRASFDLACPGSALALVPLSHEPEYPQFIKSYGVNGCGRQAVYVIAPSGTWMLNSPVTASPPPPSPVSAPPPAAPAAPPSQ